jgi:hypothetical protein
MVDILGPIFVALSLYKGMGFPSNRPMAHEPDG